MTINKQNEIFYQEVTISNINTFGAKVYLYFGVGAFAPKALAEDKYQEGKDFLNIVAEFKTPGWNSIEGGFIVVCTIFLKVGIFHSDGIR